RIHTLPPRLIERVIATRAASICRSVIQAHSMAFSPNSPNDTFDPRHAFPAMRPRCCFLYLTFLGIIMAVYSPSSLLPWREHSCLPRPDSSRPTALRLRAGQPAPRVPGGGDAASTSACATWRLIAFLLLAFQAESSRRPVPAVLPASTMAAPATSTAAESVPMD